MSLQIFCHKEWISFCTSYQQPRFILIQEFLQQFLVTGCNLFHPPIKNMDRSVTTFGSILASITLVHEFVIHHDLLVTFINLCFFSRFQNVSSRAVLCSTNWLNTFPLESPTSSSRYQSNTSDMYRLFRPPISWKVAAVFTFARARARAFAALTWSRVSRPPEHSPPPC